MRCEKPIFIQPGKGYINRATFEALAPDLKLQLTPLPCGRCLQCRIHKARCWTARNILEACDTEKTCFVTLTFDEMFLPINGCLNNRALQLYFKRLRKSVAPRSFRYFAVGEYGAVNMRPHFHVLLYGLDHTFTRNIVDNWGCADPEVGIEIGDVTPQSIRYVTEYCVKKWDDRNGRKPAYLTKEFFTSSRGKLGGIGKPALLKVAANMRRDMGLEKKDYWKTEPPAALRFAGKTWPLDRYMKNVLWDALKVHPKAREEAMEQWQMDLFDEHSQTGFFDLKKAIKIKNKEIATKWNRKYYKRMKVLRTL